ncbi:hypothetical protein ACFQNF_15235 [Iodobacter arcticus]|uniref:Periplasmic protein n=1 Tax=Iodobacter arcticus TaxID=590593 RepID=A0ABW2R570_9NEIS
MKKYLLIASMIASFAATAAWADISKWVDNSDIPKVAEMHADARSTTPPDMMTDTPRKPNQADDASAPTSTDPIPSSPLDDDGFGD